MEATPCWACVLACTDLDHNSDSLTVKVHYVISANDNGDDGSQGSKTDMSMILLELQDPVPPGQSKPDVILCFSISSDL